MIELSKKEGVALMTEVGRDAWYVYSYLRTLSSGGSVAVTQSQLAELMQRSERYVRENIKILAVTEVKSYPMVKVERTADGNVYSLAVFTMGTAVPISSNTIELNPLKEVIATGTSKPKEKPLSSTNELFDYWREGYFKQYGTEYRIGSFAREKGQIRTLIKKYGEDVSLLKEIVNVVFRLYETKWRSQQFQRPTIGALLSWLAAQAEPFARANIIAEQDKTIQITDMDSDDDGLDIFDKYDKHWGGR